MLIDDRTTPVERLQASGDEAGTAPEDRRFRPDVQGLRAVAVTLVLLFHAHVPGMGGGYVGVDVFFVISGFVITGVLLRERTSTAKTSIARFYARRVRRIIPAATVVIVVAVVASYVVLGPLGGAQTAGDARWASFFLINVHFASTGTNYLASLRPPSVLQNYWSLAVEEQFYLVYPTIFLVVARLSLRSSLRRRLAIVLGAAVVASFALSVVQTSSNQTAAYFSTFPRVCGTRPRGSRRHRDHRPAACARFGRGGDVVGRARPHSLGRRHLLVVDAVPRLGGRPPGPGSGPGHCRWRRRAASRSRVRSAPAAMPMGRAHFVLSVPLALARAHHRRRAQRERDALGLGRTGVDSCRRCWRCSLTGC